MAALTIIVTQVHTLDAHLAALLRSTPTPTSSSASRARKPCARPGCSPRSGTAAPASPPRIPRLPGRGHSVHPAVREDEDHLVPLEADKQLRDAVCDFAADSRFANPWAAQLYNASRARGHRHPHAVRIVARAWLHVIWRCWQDHQPYDPARHHALQAVLRKPGSQAEATATQVSAA